MRLAFSTNAFTRFSLLDAINAIADAGYEGVELLADEPHAYPLKIDAALTTAVAGAIERRGLGVSNINCNCTFGYWKDAPPEPYFEPSLISPIERHREDRIAMITRCLQFARDVGANNISMTSGRMLGGIGPDRATGLLHDGLRRVLDRAEHFGVNVGIECEPGLYVEWADELADLIATIGSPRLGANLDVGHCQVLGEDIPAAIRTLAGRIWNLHVEGMPSRKHYHLIPGDPLDTFDWPALIDGLRSIAYDRFATVELYTMTADPNDAAARSHRFLSDRLI